MRYRQVKKILFRVGGTEAQRARAWKAYWKRSHRHRRRWAKSMHEICEKIMAMPRLAPGGNSWQGAVDSLLAAHDTTKEKP